MKYMLDTNICIYMMKGRIKGIRKRLSRLSEDDEVCISAIALSELHYGIALSSKRTENAEELRRFMAPLAVEHFGPGAAERYGELRRYLSDAGKMIGHNDLLIAAHALAADVTLVTNNTREFSRVPGLKTENWAD